MSHSASQHYDAIVIGSGQSGTPLAKAFAKAGRKTALVESSHCGGTCINEGCTPTKTMIASGRVAYLARRAADYGVHTSSTAPGTEAGIRIDMAKIRQRKRDIVDSWSAGSKTSLEKAGVDLLLGEARFEGTRSLQITMKDGGPERTVSGSVILINTGERPSRPPLDGLDTIDKGRILDSTSIMELGEVPRHLLVIGGGYVGLEFGQLFRRLGAEVTIIQRAAQLVPREDEDVAEMMKVILEQDGIKVLLSTQAQSIQNSGDVRLPIQLKASSGELLASHVLLAAGRRPNTDVLNLAAAGVNVDQRGHMVVNESLETNVPGIYALGDVHGGPAFTHISYDDFRIIRANLLPESIPLTMPAVKTTRASKSRNLTPYVVYADPQLGHIGLHEKDLKRSGRKYKTAKMPMSYVARAIETDETRGLMKATVDADTGEILGFTCLGVEGGEVMAIVQAAMMGNLKWWDLEAAVWAHPSLAESLNNLWGYFE